MNLPGPQNVSGVVSHHIDGALYQRNGYTIRGIGPGSFLRLYARFGDVTMASSREWIDLKSVIKIIAKTIEVSQQVQMRLHRPAASVARLMPGRTVSQR